MSWVGEVTSKAIDRNSGGCIVTVDFYDDARKDETKVTHTFNWVPGTTGNQARDDVIARGTEIKTKYSLFDVIEIGMKVTIP